MMRLLRICKKHVFNLLFVQELELASVQVERASRAVSRLTQSLLQRANLSLQWRPLYASSSSRLMVVSLGVIASTSTRARMENVSGAVQKDTRFLRVHDLPRRSLRGSVRASLSNRLKVRGDLPLPRLRPNLPRVLSQRHSPRKTVPKEEVKVRRISLLPSLLTSLPPRRPPSPPRSLLRNPVPSLGSGCGD